MLKKKKEFGKFSRKKENQIKFFLSTWARRFNIFITLIGYYGGYPRATRGEYFFAIVYTAEVIPGRRKGGIFPLRASEGIDIFFFQHLEILLIFAT